MINSKNTFGILVIFVHKHILDKLYFVSIIETGMNNNCCFAYDSFYEYYHLFMFLRNRSFGEMKN